MTTRPAPLAPPDPTGVLIAGAGIAGLAAAIAIARSGRSVTVLEKRTDASEDGAGIQIGPNGMRILRTLGILQSLDGKLAFPHGIRVMDGLTGHALTTFPLGHDIEARHGAPYAVLHRADLHAALRNAASAMPSIAVRTGTGVVTAQTRSNEVHVETSTGETLNGKLLIGADGIWSNLRSAVMHAPPLAFAGKSAYRTVIAADQVPPGISCSDTTVWLMPSAHIVHYPVRAGSELAMVAIVDDTTARRSWADVAEPSTVRDRFRQAPEPLRSLLHKPSAWRQWSLHTTATSFPWTNDRIVLIGDAAHPMLPFLAQGGVMALEDASVLAALLDGADGDQIPARLRTFEHIRRPRTTRVIESSARNGHAYHLDGMMRRARNAVLAATPPALFMRQYDWLYGWTLEDALKSARIPAGTARAR